MNDNIVTIATVELEDRGLTLLREKVEKLNKRAKRHGMEALELRILSSESFDKKIRVGKEFLIVPAVRYTVEINGCEPCIGGWRLAAKVEFNDTIGNVVRIAPGRDDDGSFERYRAIGPVCEHCNTNRRRNDVFVLEDSDGYRRIIGRNCLADYLRCGDAADLARWAEWMDDIRSAGDDDSEGGEDWREFTGGRGNPCMPLGAYLRIVAVVKRKFGWMGRTAARDSYSGVATADIAARVIYGKGEAHERWLREAGLSADDSDGEYADKAIEWAAGLDSNGQSEYINVIGNIARAGLVDMRKLDGYAASILIAHDKAREREIEYAERAKNAKNKVWFGTAKKREKGVRVKCAGLHSFEGHYGVTTIVRFEHYPDGPDGADKAILVWFASGDRYNDWNEGDDYTIDATVKGHDDHDKYGKQTKINRVKDVS